MTTPTISETAGGIAFAPPPPSRAPKASAKKREPGDGGVVVESTATGRDSRQIALTAITVDMTINQRAAGLDEDHVLELVAVLRDGKMLPAVEVVCDSEGQTVWLADGFHRARAHALTGAMAISCLIREGDRRTAVLIACVANQTHGLKRSRADKRKSIATVLADPEWRQQSDRTIAKSCGVDDHTVADVRRTLSASAEIRGYGDGDGALLPEVPDVASSRRKTVKARRNGREFRMKLAPPRPPRLVDKPAILIGALSRLEEAATVALQHTDCLRVALHRHSTWTARRLHQLRNSVGALVARAEQELGH